MNDFERKYKHNDQVIKPVDEKYKTNPKSN